MLRASLDCPNCTYSKSSKKSKKTLHLLCTRFGHTMSDKPPLSISCKFYNDKEEERIKNKGW